MKAKCLLAAKCYSDALTDLQEVLTQESWNLQAHFLIAKCLAAGAENSQSKSADLMQHLELVAKAEDPYYSGNALYLLARVLAKDK